MDDAPLTYSRATGEREGLVVIKLTGPLTLKNIFEFQKNLAADPPQLTVFDLSDVPYMDSAGIGVLINYYVSAEKHGRRMALAGVNERVEALLDMTKVRNLLRSFPTTAEAEAQV
ncbi:STAS domain-containing protein [Edaphobacter aggregans]|uniref:STAS domain-containing protein n=1 Tax=Edaphobacter aggregans TaxID=570835 RepID=UPI0005589D90|nr:STAS domain-containing protein [Edaphobacter aggregans]